MRFLVLFLFLLQYSKLSHQNFISLTSSFTHSSSPYKLFFQSSNITDPSTILITFQNEVKTLEISGKQKEFSSLLKFPPQVTPKKFSTLQLLINQKMKCSTKSFTLKNIQSTPHTFIQFDKPIYMPNDTVKFHIVMIDKEGRGVHANNIEIIVSDSRGIKIETIDDLTGQQSGLFIGSFVIGEDVNVGEWKISVKVNRDARTKVEKSFKVEKYLLSNFGIEVEVDKSLKLRIKAEDIFGELAIGKFKIEIENFEGDKIFSADKFGGEIIEDLRLEFEGNYVNLKVVVTFEDNLTKMTARREKFIKVFDDKNFKIVTEHPYDFYPGKPYIINAKVVGADENFPLKLTQIYLPNNFEVNLINSSASFELKTLEDWKNFDVELSYRGYKIKEVITPLTVFKESIEIEVDKKIYTPNDFINIKIESPSNLNKINVVVSTKFGVVHSETVDCDDEMVCRFLIQSTNEMTPQAVISVYSMENVKIIQRGSKVVKFDEVKTKFDLKISPSTIKTSPGSSISFKISSFPDSTVNLFAFDKRLSFLVDDQKNFKDFLTETFSKPTNNFLKSSDGFFDGENLLLIDDLSSWHHCNESEKRLLNKVYKIEEYNHKIEPIPLKAIKSDFLKFPKVLKMNDDKIRKNLSEVWIFERFKLESETEIKTFVLPDSATTWTVSAFATHKQGTAFIEPFEIMARKDFYIEVLVPKNAKFNDILEVQVIAFNYLENPHEINVEINLEGNEETFEVYESKLSCETSLNAVKNLKIPHLQRSSTTFYINPILNEEILLNFKASAKIEGRTLSDEVNKVLKLESEAIKFHDTQIYLINFRGRNWTERHFGFEFKNARKQSIRLRVEVSGNIMAKGLKYKDHESLLLSETGVQGISKFSKAFYIYKYLNSAKKLGKRQKEALKEVLKKNFEDIIKNYRNQDGGFYVHKKQPNEPRISSIWLTAYIAKVFGEAMKLKAIDSDSEIIIAALNFLKTHQQEKGTFNETVLSSLPSNPDVELKKQTFHITCFVLHAFKVNQNYLDKELLNVTSKAFKYIEDNVYRADNYDGAFAAFLASTQDDKTFSKNILIEIEKRAHTDGVVKFYKLLLSKKTSGATKVLITSYVIMSYLNLGEFSKAANAIKWLINEKDEDGNFNAIFDTNIALEALTEVEKYSNVNDPRMSIKFSTHGHVQGGERTNLLDMSLEGPKFIDFPIGITQFSMTIDGEGFAMITAHYEYLLGAFKNSKNFTIDVVVENVNEEGAELNFCGSYVGEELESFMAIIEITFDGFVYDQKSNPMMQNDLINNVELRRRGEVVKIYFEELTNEKSCFGIFVKKDQNNIQRMLQKSSAKIYNFYEKGIFAVSYFDIMAKGCN